MRRRRRKPAIRRWLALLAGLAIGLALGLTITWVLWPVEYTNADPADLRPSYKDDYVRMVAAAYQMNGNLSVAKRRLAQLNLGAPAQTVNDFLAREKTNPNTKTQIALARLDQSLYADLTPRPSPTITRTVPSTPTAVAAITASTAPTPTVAAPTVVIPAFRLIERTSLTCSDEPEQAHLRFFVRDASGKDLPNVAIEIRWATGDDTVYTGLKPERGVGYADFQAAPDTYSVSILNATGESARDLRVGEPPANCRSDRGATPRGWKLVFQQQ